MNRYAEVGLLFLSLTAWAQNNTKPKPTTFLSSATSGNITVVNPVSLKAGFICINVEPLKGETEDEFANRIRCTGNQTGHHYQLSRIEEGSKLP